MNRSLICAGVIAAVAAGIGQTAGASLVSAAAADPCARANAAVDSIVGFRQGTFTTVYANTKVPASAATGGATAVATRCIFTKRGTPMEIILTHYTISRSRTLNEIIREEKAGNKGATVKTYPGLSVPAIVATAGNVKDVAGAFGSNEFHVTFVNALAPKTVNSLAKIAANL
ncbi:MAG TPA: hypothetical protein VG265_09945 [Gaiellaceae bacterium]|nr:hypothetical protein [Gaiellaceae bacterium]